MTSNYQVEEYTSLDFEHIVLETEEVGAVCPSCNSWHSLIQSGIWQCEACGSINHKDL